VDRKKFGLDGILATVNNSREADALRESDLAFEELPVRPVRNCGAWVLKVEVPPIERCDVSSTNEGLNGVLDFRIVDIRERTYYLVGQRKCEASNIVSFGDGKLCQSGRKMVNETQEEKAKGNILSASSALN